MPLVSLYNVTVMRSDASWKENRNIAGLGWVIYREDGPMKFSVVEEHVSTSLMAESIAMRGALANCKEFAVSDVKHTLNSLLHASGRNNQFQRFMELHQIL